MATWTVDRLLASMKRKANLPGGANAKFSDPQIAAIAGEVLLKQVDPILQTLQEEYDVRSEDFAITANDGTYAIPERAVSGTLSQVLLTRANGDTYPLERLGGSDVWQFSGASSTASEPAFYTLEGNTIRLLPTPTSSGLTLRVRYRRRPAELVLTTACGTVTVVGATTLTAPGGTFGATPRVDVVRALPPLGPLVMSALTGYAANVFTFAAGVLTDAGVSVGDFVCLYDSTCVVPLPERYYELLSDLATAQLCEEWGDLEQAATKREVVDTYLSTMKTAQSNRVSAQPLKAFQRVGVLRGSFGRRYVR